MIGLVKASRLGPMGPSPSGASLSPRSVPRALRSAPAQNVPPAPQSTATRRRSSCSNSRNVSASARAAGPSTAFRASGRSMTIVATASCRSSRMAMRGLLVPRWRCLLSLEARGTARIRLFDDLPVGVFANDAAVSKGVKIASPDLDAPAARARAGEGPFGNAGSGALVHEVLGVAIVDVGQAGKTL